jgi:hypothetical protein
VPISQKRELEIERELAAIMRELDRHSPANKTEPKKPEQAVQLPWAPPLTSRLRAWRSEIGQSRGALTG